MTTQLGHWHIFYEFVANVNIRTFVGKFKKYIYRFAFYVVVLQKQLRARRLTHPTVICLTVAVKAKAKQLQINSFLYFVSRS